MGQQSSSASTGAPRDWERFRSLYEMFLETVGRRGSSPALIAKRGSKTYNVTITYNEWAASVQKMAHSFLKLGIERGDRIAISSNNRPEWVTVDLACQAIGAADVPIYPTLTAKQMAYIINDSGSRIMALSDEKMLAKILEVESEILTVEHIVCFETPTSQGKRIKIWTWNDMLELGTDPQWDAALKERLKSASLDDLASIVYTSGTTGEPKGAMLLQRNLVSNPLSVYKLVGLNETDVELCFLPLCHVFERAVYYAMVAAGGSIAYAESIDTVPANLIEIKPSIVASVPRLFEKIHARILDGVAAGPRTKRRLFNWAVQIGHRYQARKFNRESIPPVLEIQHALAKKLVFLKVLERTGGRVKFFISGGAPLRRDLGEFFRAVGLTILEGFGLTETSPVMTMNRLERPKFGTVGQTIPDVEVRIADDGEIVVRGPNIMKGYFNKPVETKEAIDPEGWFHTGDLGAFDSEGYLAITGRKKELLVLSNGKKVAPAPIENSLKASNYIEQAVVIGDNRNFVGAIIVPTFDALKRYAEAEGMAAQGPAELVKNEKILKLISDAVAEVNKELAQYEKIKQFAVLPREFSQDLGEMTPTLKPKRKVILETFQADVDKIYSGDGKKPDHAAAH